MLKKLLLTSLLLPTISFASVKGIGEYFYGPDTSENLACFFAEEKAKENAVEKFSGTTIYSTTSEICLTNECSFVRETNNNVSGIVRDIKHKKTDIRIEEGQRVCVVEIDAVVEKMQRGLILSLDHFSPIIQHESLIRFSMIVNRPGRLVLFNYYDGYYHKIYDIQNHIVNASFDVPAKERILAKVPEGRLTSKEKLVFVYTTLDISVKTLYNEFEMKNFLQSMPIQKSFIVNRFVQIVR